MPAGRPAKPIALHKLEGTFRKDRHGEANAPQPMLPDPPQYLTDTARAEWERAGQELLAQGLMTALSSAAFEVYVTAKAQLALAGWHLKREGSVRYDRGSPPDEDGYQERGPKWITSPWVAIHRSAQEMVLKAQREFGMSPAGWSKVSPSKPEELDPLDALASRSRNKRPS